MKNFSPSLYVYDVILIFFLRLIECGEVRRFRPYKSQSCKAGSCSLQNHCLLQSARPQLQQARLQLQKARPQLQQQDRSCSRQDRSCSRQDRSCSQQCKVTYFVGSGSCSAMSIWRKRRKFLIVGWWLLIFASKRIKHSNQCNSPSKSDFGRANGI